MKCDGESPPPAPSPREGALLLQGLRPLHPAAQYPFPQREGAFLRFVAQLVLIMNILVIIYKKFGHISTHKRPQNPVYSQKIHILWTILCYNDSVKLYSYFLTVP